MPRKRIGPPVRTFNTDLTAHAGEIWKPCPRHPGYEVSDHGRVRSVSREILGMRHGKMTTIRRAGVMLKQTKGSGGYPTVGPYGERPVLVHALVCEAFHGPRPDGYQVAHGDGSRDNNRADNLRWATPSENNLDKRVHGTHQDQRGEKAWNAKLKNEDVLEIRANRGSVSQTYLARRFGVNPSVISTIQARKKWAHIPEGGASNV